MIEELLEQVLKHLSDSEKLATIARKIAPDHIAAEAFDSIEADQALMRSLIEQAIKLNDVMAQKISEML